MHSVTSRDEEEDGEGDARETRAGLAGNCRQDKDEENEEGCGAGTMAGLRWQIAVLWKFLAVESMPNALNNIPQPSSRGLV